MAGLLCIYPCSVVSVGGRVHGKQIPVLQTRGEEKFFWFVLNSVFLT